jgi:carbon monoxide dehydrogenase subunit G
MEFDHEFTVPVPVSQAWAVLLDVERIAPCMPGATLDSMDGDEFAGRLRVKLGAMTITYKGTAKILSADEQTHVVIIEGSGKEARGSGTASSTVQAELHDEGEQTRVTVHSKLAVTGKPAQFGRNILAEVGGKLIGRFADSLAKEISQETTEPAETVEPAAAVEPEVAKPERQAESLETMNGSHAAGMEVPSVPRPRAGGDAGHVAPVRPAHDEEPVNLLEVAGPSIAKRVVPAVGAVVLLVLFVRYLLRRRR